MKFFNKIEKYSFNIIGVTGTSGKTVLSHLIRHIFFSSNESVAIISSLEMSINGKLFSNLNAHTLNKRVLSKFLNECTKSQIKYLVIEVPSENAHFFKNLNFDLLALTNIQSHNEYLNWNDYAQSKLEIIKQIKNNGMLILDAHDSNIEKWIYGVSDQIKQNIFTVSVNSQGITNAKLSINGTSFILGNSVIVESTTIGEANYKNIQLAIQVCKKYLNVSSILTAIKTFKNPIGRFDIYTKNPFTIIIDKANTPESLESALSFLNSVKDEKSKLISVIGSNIKKDRYNSKLGFISNNYADITILTSQDPETNSVYSINSAIFDNLSTSNTILLERYASEEEFSTSLSSNLVIQVKKILNSSRKVFFSFDENLYTGRLNAIRLSVKLLEPGDILYINGKGSDTSTVYGYTVYEWSDYEAVRIALEEKNKTDK